MRLEILPQTTLRSTNPQTTINLSRLAPGDLLEARVIGPSSNGQTLLKVGDTIITSEQQLGAKPGDVLRLEVQSAPQGTTPSNRPRLWFAVRRIEVVHHPRPTPSEPTPSTPPFPALQITGRNFVSADLFRSLAVMRHGDAALAELTQFAAAHLMEPAALINRQRIQNFRKRYLRRVANKGGDTEMKPLRGVHAGEPRAIKGALHHNLSENRELEAPHEYRGAFGIASQSEAKAAVSIKIRTEQGSHDASWHEGTLTASLLLDLENTGVIEILLTLGEDQIWVDFRTATPHTRQRIEAELDGVHASLTALARRVYCRVRSDQQLTAPDLGAGAALCGPREIDLKI